jgi:exonuclease SbcC
MSYADAELDLSLVPIACLSGMNGAGKSALLDAITWALWESARSASDDLIRLGEREMWVDLTFIHENETYRIRRSRQQTTKKSGNRGTSKGTLEFQIKSGDNNGNSWRSLTAGAMKETQRSITLLLRMDYDTFINSAYLRQGKADEFTTRAPSDRKQVLGEILGLSLFDQLQEHAREKGRSLKNQIDSISFSLITLPEKQERQNQIEAELNAARLNLSTCSTKLSDYESVWEKQNQELAKLQLSKQKLESATEQLSHLTADMQALNEQENELTKKNTELTDLLSHTPEIEAAANQYNDLKTKTETLDQLAFQHQEWTGKRLDLQSKLATMRSQLEVELDHLLSLKKERESKKDKLTQNTADKDKFETTYQNYKRLITEEAEQAKKQEAFVRLNERASALQSKIQEEAIRMEAQLAQKHSSLAELDIILKNEATIMEDQLQLQNETATLDKLEVEFEHVEEKGLAIKSDLESTKRSIEDLIRRQKENLQKISELNESKDSTICPLCSAPIVDRDAVIERYRSLNSSIDTDIMKLEEQSNQLEEERQVLRRRYTELRQELEKRKTLDKHIGEFNEKMAALQRAKDSCSRMQSECETLAKKIENQDFAQVEKESLIAMKAEMHKLDFDPAKHSNLQGQIRAQRHIEARFHQIEHDLSELKKIEDELPDLAKRVQSIKDDLDGETYGTELRNELAKINDQTAKISYNRDEHARLKQELSQLLPTANRAGDLQKAISERSKVEESIRSTKTMLKAKHAQSEQLNNNVLIWQDELKAIPILENQLTIMKPDLFSLRTQKDELGKQVAVLENSLNSLVAELKTLSDRKKELAELGLELDDYNLLSEAFGKKGIQAIIIENTIPEIEGEANRILARLTENKMHIRLITQELTKSGNLTETLELLIADEIGTRAYELYSGGEAFKVNFAIRVALSRLLARRSGAKLETLIIDEGFGSQDDLSRERLVKAIRSVQNDFARILVITHMADIKEMFPVQIQVTKHNGTSVLELVS